MKKYLLTLAMLGIGSMGVYAQNYSGGAGSKVNPYQIATKADLKYLSENSAEAEKHFIQTADIYFSSSDFAVGGDFYNNGNGFIPVGQNNGAFTGSYNGGGHIIDSLFMNRSESAGFINTFFPDIAGDSISNLGITNANFTSSASSNGVLIGTSLSSSTGVVFNCYTSGSISGTNHTGGLVGNNNGLNIIDCHSSVNVQIQGASHAGGLVAYTTKPIYNSYATGTVSGGNQVGGLVASASDNITIENCYATGQVTGNQNCGGLVGIANAVTFINCYATGSVNVNLFGGGLIGSTGTNTRIERCYTTSNVSGDQQLGGLIGIAGSTDVLSSYSTGVVSGNNIVGGLIGKVNTGVSVDSAYTSGNITGGSFTGGLFGTMSGTIVKHSYSSGDVTANDFTGGISGNALSNARIENCYSTSTVNGTEQTGGLIGNATNVFIVQSFASGNVNGTTYVGGLVGSTGECTIENSYATGDVIATGFYIGGLVGALSTDATVDYCYAVGKVTGIGNRGGLFGSASGNFASCYWNSETSTISTGNFGAPKTTNEMQLQSTFAAWDFAQIWKMGNCLTNNAYPIFQYQTLNAITATPNFTLSATIQNELCGGTNSGAIDLTVSGTSKYNFVWSSGDFTEDVQSLSVGTYTLKVTDSATCASIDTSFAIGLNSYFPSTSQVTASTVCGSGSSTIEMTESANGASYFLRNTNNAVVDGPILGTGGPISFNTGTLTSTTDFRILGALFDKVVSLDTFKMNALEFTGNTGTKKVSLGTDLWADSFVGRSAFTIEAWVNRSSTGNLHTVLSNYNGSFPLLFRIDNDKITLYVNSSVSVQSSSTVAVGEWVHLAGTYDGTTIRVFINGKLEGSVAYNMTLSAANGELKIGGGINNSTEYFPGSIADVRFWNIAKTESEILNNMKVKLNGNETGLVANYQFNEGSGNTAANSAGSLYSGTLVNNPAWLAGPVYSHIICSEQYANTITASVSQDFPDSTTSVSMQTITSNEDGATYQWIDCNDNNKAIDGATGQSYTATVNGSYAVIVSNGTCTSTSACVDITNVGMEDMAQGEVLVYPNPSQGKVTVQLKHTDAEIQSVKVLSVLGKELSVWQGAEQSVILDLSTLAKGVYFIAISVADQTNLKRIVIE